MTSNLHQLPITFVLHQPVHIIVWEEKGGKCLSGGRREGHNYLGGEGRDIIIWGEKGGKYLSGGEGRDIIIWGEKGGT